MKITHIELFPVSSPVKRAAASGRGSTMGAIHSVVIRIHTDEGVTGVADTGNTSSWYAGETQDSIIAMIGEVIAPLALIGQDPHRIEHLVGRMDYLVRDNNQAKALVDFALHDLKGKALGVPVYELLGGLTAPRIPMGWVASGGNLDQIATSARDAVAAGFSLVKVKVGVAQALLATDLKKVAAVREAVGDGVRLDIDANGSWHYEQALQGLRALERYGITAAEQPLPYWDVIGLARLRRKVDVEIFADESAREPANLNELIRQDAVDGLFLKLVKVGGILKAQRWLTIAQAAGLPVMCGCMAGSSLEAAAYGHLLCANEWASRFVHENTGPLIIHDLWSTEGVDIQDDLGCSLPLYKDGHFHVPQGPGLGIELNEEALRRLATPGKATVRVDASTVGRHDGYRF